MQVGTTKKIGRRTYIFTGEGQNIHECVMELKKFSFEAVHKCGICEKDNLCLEAYVTKEKKYKYTVVRCRDCLAAATFGQPTDDPDTAYIRKDKNGEIEWRRWVEKDE